ncbi:hypothetical protein NA78x_003437 [Anatilimnocola sp. NA78]|uniref:hypothetical protein n=1 Tax=Anatilimnocola sp. NA78 TaxID=3415683 RepID=UPI003CE59529
MTAEFSDTGAMMDATSLAATLEDLEKAREVLKLHPDLVPTEHTEEMVSAIAAMRANGNRELFDLKMGLREPVSRREHIYRDMFQGVLTLEEAQSQMSDYASRPVDSEMFQSFFSALETRIGHYARFLQEVGDLHLHPRRQPVREEDEQRVDQLAARLEEKLKLDNREIDTVDVFLQEARIEKRFGSAAILQFTAPTVALLIMLVTRRAKEAWDDCRQLEFKTRTQPQYVRVTQAVTLFANTWRASLPQPQDLVTLLAEEQALARLYFKQQQPVAEVAPEVKSDRPGALLAVRDWSELAIGVDERGRHWALTPVPADGQHFRKSAAVELPLPPGRWEKVLSAFAESETGDQVKRLDLLSALGYFSAAKSTERDSRARPGQIEAAQVEGMVIRQQAALTRLKNTLADLRRELGMLVAGPNDRARIPLRVQGEYVLSGFKVRFLLLDDSGKWGFGGLR